MCHQEVLQGKRRKCLLALSLLGEMVAGDQWPLIRGDGQIEREEKFYDCCDHSELIRLSSCNVCTIDKDILVIRVSKCLCVCVCQCMYDFCLYESVSMFLLRVAYVSWEGRAKREEREHFVLSTSHWETKRKEGKESSFSCSPLSVYTVISESCIIISTMRMTTATVHLLVYECDLCLVWSCVKMRMKGTLEKERGRDNEKENGSK